MHQLAIYPEESLVVCVFSGQITISEIEETAKIMLSHPDFDIHLNGISDFRQAQVTFTRSELEYFNRAAIETPFTRGSWCLLADSPIETAMALIYANELKETHPVGVFSTIKGASNFLNKDLSQYLNESYRSRNIFRTSFAQKA